MSELLYDRQVANIMMNGDYINKCIFQYMIGDPDIEIYCENQLVFWRSLLEILNTETSNT